jgi:ABC-type nitrate/sulfonate/bicarbonate transport system substrate-binding protein
MRRQTLWNGLLGFLVLATVVGFSAGACAQEKIKVALHWNTPAHQFLQYYAAIKNGYYKEAGLDVELLPLAGSVPAALSVSAGDAQIGQASSDAILVSMAGGASLKVLFMFYQQTPNGVIVFQDSGIKTFKDLRGKTVASSVSSPDMLMLNARLRAIGMNPESDIKVLNVAPGAKLTMQLTGQADVSTGLADFQLIQAEMQGKKVSFLSFSTDDSPIYGHAIFANGEWLSKHQGAARKFIAATVKGLKWAHDNIPEAVKMVVNWDTSVKVDPAFAKRGWEVNLNDLVINKRTAKDGIGHMEAAGWANLIKILRDGGVLKADVDANKVFTNDYIPKDAPRW